MKLERYRLYATKRVLGLCGVRCCRDLTHATLRLVELERFGTETQDLNSFRAFSCSSVHTASIRLYSYDGQHAFLAHILKSVTRLRSHRAKESTHPRIASTLRWLRLLSSAAAAAAAEQRTAAFQKRERDARIAQRMRRTRGRTAYPAPRALVAPPQSTACRAHSSAINVSVGARKSNAACRNGSRLALDGASTSSAACPAKIAPR